MQQHVSTSSTNALEVEGTESSIPAKPDYEVLSATSSTVMIGILFTEAMASFAYYGSQIILVLYLRKSLGFSESASVAIFSFIASIADLSPTIGAALADGWLGRYKTILFFGSIAALGLFITAMGAVTNDPISRLGGNINHYDEGSTGTAWRKGLSFVGLVLLFGGVRCIDPCLSSFGADQVAAAPLLEQSCDGGSHDDDEDRQSQTEKRQLRVRTFFAYFYFCMNIGALAAYGFIPLVREYDGFGMAFLVCSFCMLVGLACLVSKRRHYVYSFSSDEDSSSLASTFAMCGRIIGQRFLQTFDKWKRADFFSRSLSYESVSPQVCSLETEKFRNVSDESSPLYEEVEACCYGACDTDDADKRSVRDAEQALRVVPILAMLPIFWMLYDQQESVWILQASRMTLHGLQPEQLCLVNPIEVSIFIPLFDQYVYPALTRYGWKLDPLARMGIGMLLAATSYLVSGGLEVVIQRAETRGIAPPSVLWQMIQITIMALSEIFVYVTGLEFAYSSAPARLKAFLVASYSLTKAVGDLFGGVLYSTVFQGWDRSTVMFVCAFLMIVNRLVFDQVANWFRSTAATSNSHKDIESRSAIPIPR